MPQNTFAGRKATGMKYLLLVSTALVGLGQPLTATAADIWFGTTSTDWFTAGNWSAGSVPTAADIVYISTTTPNPTAINAGSAFADDIYLGFTGSSDGSLVISNGTLTSGRAFLSWGDNSTSDVTVNAGSSWTSSSSLVVGSFGLATLDILNGGVVTDVVGIVAGGSNAQGVVKIDGIGSAWLNTDSLTVGSSGVGTVTVSNGGKVSSDSAYIGRYSGSTGSVTIDDATWTNNGALYVGHDGDGELVIKNGGVVSNADGIMGYSTDSNSQVIVAGAGSTWANSGSLTVGDSGKGFLVIDQGGAVSDDLAHVGNAVGSTGIVFVDGAGSTWTNSSALFVGEQGTGALAITNSGAVNSDLGFVGYGVDSVGTVAVDGAGSKWTNSSDLFVGGGGTGKLTISNGGAVSNANGYVGYDSTGTVTVDGAGSKWTNSSDLFIGGFDTGSLTISNGGTVGNGGGYLGYAADSAGTAAVDGAGSKWTNSGDLYVGAFGTGTLTISNGGAASNGSGFVGYSAASTGTVAVDGAGSAWINSGSLIVGDVGTGTLAITQGGTVGNSWAAIGAKAGSTGMVFVDGAGSTWTNSSNLAIGDFGTGTLSITNGGAVSNAWGYVGNSAGSTGTVAVDGAGSKWTNSGNLYIGGLSTGTLTISNGGAVSNVEGYMANTAGFTSTVVVDGGSTWTNSGHLIIGDVGNGTLAISNASIVSDTKGFLALEIGSAGGVSVDGPGSAWMNSGDLLVGFKGAGALQVTNGGHVLNQAASLGEFDTATATVTVDGAGSSWSTDDLLAVGGNGHATLSISNGGSADADSVFVGQSATASGSVAVDGGSNLTNKNGLLLGVLGSGTLAVTNGGIASGGLTAMAIGAAATAQATVDGTGSLWEMHGDLVIGLKGTASVTLSNDGTALVDFATVIASQAGSTGTLNIGGAAGAAATGAGILDSATLQFGFGTGALNFNHTNTNYTFDAAISGLGTINQIAGNTNLTADSSGFTGATNVSGGRLAVNGSLASSLVTITGGMLGGNGTVGGIAAQSGGIIAPGNSIGTLNVAGNVDQAAGSIYLVELTSTGTSDFLHAAGTATIDSGALIDVVKLDGAPYVAGTHYTVLQADGGVTGTYTFGGNTGTAFLGLVDSYDANHLYLDVVQKSFASVGLTPNQIAAGAGAESLGSGNPLFDAIFALPSEAAAQDAFDQLSGEIHASARGMLLEDSRFIRDAATSRISAAFGDAGSTAALPVMAYGEGGPEMVAADTDRFAVWGQAFGSWGNTDSDGNAAAFDRSTGGLLAGADTQLGTWRVGLLGGYSHSSFDADDRNSSGKSDSYHLGLYGGTNWGAIAFRTGAAYSWNSLSTKRAVAFNGFTDGLSADYDAGTAQAFGELAYKADAGHFKFEPFANLAYVSVHTDGFSETGGAAALTSAGSTTDATFTTLGLRASTDLGLGEIKATVRGMLGWRHAFGDDTPASSFAFAGGDLFTIAGVPVARDAAVVEAGLDLNMSANATLGLSYTGQFGGGTVDQGAKVNLGLRF
ncbi:autotransporter domain-containing protein [Mesorhizobium sp. M0047]|uniref:autotransporter outer membrane beta-barrel domain-containing protein n=1 Tax=Mesorhizobium sp. M0047 TaxID=2956859 RepID=UPI00333ACA51